MKVKTVEVEIKRDVTHSVVKTVPVYEVDCLKVIYGDSAQAGDAGKPLEVDGPDAELARLKGVYGSVTDAETGQPRGVCETAFGTDAAFADVFAKAVVKPRQKADQKA